MRRFVALALVLAAAAPAFAGEPLATDDASVLPQGACQIETWVRYDRDLRFLAAVPACSPLDGLELSAGAAAYDSKSEGRHAYLVLQAKAMLYRDPDERWALAASFGALRDTGRPSGRIGFQDAGSTLIASWFASDTLRMHANGGIAYSHDSFTTGTWGAAVEWDVDDRWTALADTFRDAPGRPKFLGGVRYTVTADRLELFAAAGDRFHGTRDTWFVKLGFRVQFDVAR